MSKPTLCRLRQDLSQAVEFRSGPGDIPWLRAAIALVAAGYTAAIAHRLLFLPPPPWAHLMEISAAVIAIIAFAAFPRSPHGASATVLLVVWAEPILSIASTGEMAASKILALPVVVAMAGLVFGRRSAVLAALITLVVLPLAIARHFLADDTIASFSAADLNTLIVAEFVLAGTGLITWAMIRSLDRALAQSERLRLQYSDLFNHSPNGLIALDDTGRIVEINAPAARMLGLARAGLYHRAFGDLLVEAGATTPVDLAATPAGTPFEIVLAGNGTAPRCLELVHQIEQRPEPRTIIALTNVTERRRAELQLRESEERFRSLVESVPNIAVQGYDRERRVIFWNTASTALYGFTEEEALGHRLEDLIIPDAMRAGTIAAISAWVRDGVQIPAGELTLKRKDGSPVHVFSSHVMQFNTHSEPEMYCIDVDLTERDRATAVLRESEARFRVLFNSSNDALLVFTLHADGSPDRFIEVNHVACTRLEYTREELLQLTPLDLEPRAAVPIARERLARLRTSGRILAESEHVTKSGRRFAVEISAHLFELNERLTVLAVVRDVSARQLLEQKLRQAQKMEVVGRLAGGVAHDFNNILTAMLLNLEVMRARAIDAGTRSQIQELDDMAKRAAKLTQQLLTFARRQTLQTSRMELNAALAAVLKMLQRLLGEHITISLQVGERQLWLEADPGLLDQVVMNLCLNARDAMPDGGSLQLATSLVRFDAVIPPEHPEARPGTFVCLRVSDTGAGMSADVVQHLFEPFFTTKEVGQGTGLGLASVHGIIHQHQGWIEVESAVGRGSTFAVYLPGALTLPPLQKVAPPRDSRVGGSETILLVEDDEIVRRVTQAMLGMLGYRVLTAANSAEALRIWNVHSATIDLLFTDMIIPGGVTGLKLGEQLRQSRPGLRVVLMTGYSSEIDRGEAQRSHGVAFLAKPFESRTLAATIRQTLDQA